MTDERTEEWLPVPEAALRLGISESAVRSRVGRRTLRSRKDNHGSLVVLVGETSAKHRAFVGEPSAEPTGPRQSRQEAAETVPLSAHREMVEALHEAHRAAMAMMLERVDAAECRAERVEEHLTRVLDTLLTERRPWWSRWFGHSKRSDLGG